MPKLLLVRGLPGSGKSTYAKSLKDYFHVEADQYFVNKEGIYSFDGLKISDAHDWCQKQAALALEKGENVVVSNTFTQLWEMKPYFDMAETLKIPIQVIEMKNHYGSIHNIPERAMERMKSRWEEYDGI